MTSFIGFFKKLVEMKYVLKNMVVRDMKSRYSGSFLGMIWSFLNPLALIGTYYFVFSVVLKVRLGAQYGDANFTVWLISGLLPWIYFSEVVTRSTTVIICNSNLITKTQFPSEVLPVVTLLGGMINHFILICILIILGVVLKVVPITLSLLWIIPFLISTTMFAMGVSWLVSSIDVYLRDMEQFIGIVMNLWFYFTPIIYDIGAVPERFKNILRINPMYYIAQGYREAILNKADGSTVSFMIISLIISGVFFVIGASVFKNLKDGFADVL